MVLTENLLKQPCSHSFHKFEMKDCEFSHHKKYMILDNHYILKGFTNTIWIMLSVPLRYSLNKISLLSFLYLIACYCIFWEMYICIIVLLYSSSNPKSMNQWLKRSSEK